MDINGRSTGPWEFLEWIIGLQDGGGSGKASELLSMCLLPHFLNSEVGSLDRSSVSCTIIMVAKK